LADYRRIGGNTVKDWGVVNRTVASSGLKYTCGHMAESNCVHGLDSRFCSICNRAQRPPARRLSTRSGHSTLVEILHYLDETQVRATYGAVAEVIGVVARSIGTRLAPRRVEASWVVNAWTGLPTDYATEELHPALLRSSDVITTGEDLRRRLHLWKAKSHASPK
jgi:alkylated DNA nucleotide flippase Atl1